MFEKCDLQKPAEVEIGSEPMEAKVNEHEVNSLGDSTACQQVKEKKMKQQVTGNHSERPTIGESWLSEFKREIEMKHYNHKFDSTILRILDEYRKSKDQGIYNDINRVIARKHLTHLNLQAKQEDEYDPARMKEVVNAYKGYHTIMTVLEKLYMNETRPKIRYSKLFFGFVVRDFLTRESHRVIREDPVTAALKMVGFSPWRIAEKFNSRERYSVTMGIDHIRKRMAAKVSSDLAQWCHAFLPAEAERWALPKEPVRNEFEDGASFDLVYSLMGLEWDAIDFDSISDLDELKYKIELAESLIEDGHVFYFGSEESTEGFYLLYVTEKSTYYQQHIGEKLRSLDTEGLTLLPDNEKLAAILDTGISPIMIAEAEIYDGELAA